MDFSWYCFEKEKKKKKLVGHLAFFKVVITLVKVLIKNTESNVIAITDCPSNTNRDGLGRQYYTAKFSAWEQIHWQAHTKFNVYIAYIVLMTFP